MTEKEVVKKFVEKPTRMKPGVTYLSNKYNCRPEVIYRARRIARLEIWDIKNGYKKRTNLQKLGNWLIFKGWK
jgi:hypothetical protein